MPFDSIPEIVAIPTIEQFRKRREEAVALWRSIPGFNLRMDRWECGSTACALGWLARKNHDGWHFVEPNEIDIDGGRVPFGPYQKSCGGIIDAARYFGLSGRDANRLFSGGVLTAELCHYKELVNVTPADVGAALLRLPYKEVSTDAV